MPRNGAPPRKPKAKHRLAKATTPAPLTKGERRVELDLWGTGDNLPGFTLTAKGLSIQGTEREFEALIKLLKA